MKIFQNRSRLYQKKSKLDFDHKFTFLVHVGGFKVSSVLKIGVCSKVKMEKCALVACYSTFFSFAYSYSTTNSFAYSYSAINSSAHSYSTINLVAYPSCRIAYSYSRIFGMPTPILEYFRLPTPVLEYFHLPTPILEYFCLPTPILQYALYTKYIVNI